ncbi:MAG: tRNA glutamyl-Q(34) synthetase GluQRS [Flavobacteriaceae bacterium]|nr:tRNA glutamyl-Q(34) synthetase GluQRS [Flavobacteriaceae bacterium]
MYIGRFAPTPSGPLHFGSIVTAIASFLDAKSNKGKWLLKIDDIDEPRVRDGSVSEILKGLERLGLAWDDHVIYQSQRKEQYQFHINDLKEKGLLYNCNCSRKTINNSSLTGSHGLIYNGTCREKNLKNQTGCSIRIKVVDEDISIIDSIQGEISQNIHNDIGDFILKRSDDIFSYQFSVVVDNHLDNISHIIRGYDLINSLPRQFYLHKVMGFDFPKSSHIPIATLGRKKLSKGHGDRILIQNYENLIWMNALTFLGQPTQNSYLSMTVEDIIQHAIKGWSKNKVKGFAEREIDEHAHR